MTAKAGWATPMLHVAEIEKSIDFYTKLGFEVIDTDGGKPLGWARLHCEGGAMMFLRGEHKVNPEVQGVMFFMYAPELVPLRKQLVAQGIAVSEITYPGYMPSGEMNLRDPDGYFVSVVHWGNKEDEAWQKKISRKEA